MKIAIHNAPGTFSDRWIEYCKNNHIDYKLVNCYDTDIINQLEDSLGLMWHWLHFDYRDFLFARQLTYSLEHINKRVFPDSKTCWHFDDKIGQKYLLESVGAPLVPSHIFYDKKTALDWVDQAMYPKVFKTRCGAGSSNVILVKNKKQAKSLIAKAFSTGFPSIQRTYYLKERIWHLQRDKNLKALAGLLKGIARYIIPPEIYYLSSREKGYIYFQDFMPDNLFDIRVIVIGDRAFAIKRMVRKNDFRASGSGFIIYDPAQIPLSCVKTAFEYSKILSTQSVAFDFVFNQGEQFIVEISYGFSQAGYLPCPGYWDSKLHWKAGAFHPEDFMIEDFIQDILKANSV